MVGICISSRKIGRTAVNTRVGHLSFQPSSLWAVLIELGTGWLNTEFREYVFSLEFHTEDLDGKALEGDNATLVETVDSRARRGKEGPMAGRRRQSTLYRRGTQDWDEQGLQLSSAEREVLKNLANGSAK